MATINFLYRSKRDVSNLNIRLLYRVADGNSENGFMDKVLSAKTQYEVSRTYWKNLHKSNSKDLDIKNKQAEVNFDLSKIQKHVLDIFNETFDKKSLTNAWLKEQMEKYYNPIQKIEDMPNDLIGVIDSYIKSKKGENKPASIKKYYVVKNKMLRFQSYLGKQIFIIDINDEFKRHFVNYYKKESYSQNTTHRELVIIKTFCKYAKSKGVLTSPELDTLKLKREIVDKIFLTFEELDAIDKKEYEHDYLINAKDWLVLSCFTGQRVSDFMRFTKDMIRLESGKKFIEFRQVKTGKLMTVPLHPKVLEVLNRRNGEFPRKISDPRYNEYIKEVCELAEIDEVIEGKKQKNISEDKKVSKIRTVSGLYPKHQLVTSHIGRRSFATNFYGTIPTTLLINVTGHSTEAMFLNYIGKSNKDLAVELTKYF
ncbi:phage integrase SAM-like domain-containing protein [Psychroserpens jangbogonensis]|uniref:phage integrase SAM-like domain-containing protein n=1 Tax=Psychroserpens jangbogonensis TaxID=1484460 RepID=UPI00068E897B|nr:phage integrase SAM-like domain-containing protein [Psychroserpens jangbogonensis]